MSTSTRMTKEMAARHSAPTICTAKASARPDDQSSQHGARDGADTAENGR